MRARAHPTAVGLLATLLASCGNGPAAPDDPDRFVGFVDARPWAGAASATVVQGGSAGDTLYVFGFRRYDSRSSDADLSVAARVAPFSGPGVYALSGDAASLTELVGGDVATGRYRSAGASAGVVRVEGYDGALVSGSLEFTARREGGQGSYGDEVAVSGGFRASIYRPLVRAGEPER